MRNPHLGVAEARNAGAARATDASRYLMFLDADDLWDPEALATLVDALDRRPDAAGSFVLAEYIDDDGNVLYPGDFPRHMRGREDLRDGRLVPRDSAADVQFEHLFLSNLVYPPSCLLLRRAAYEAAGGFDGRFLAEDWEFVARLAKQGPFVPVDRVLAGYRRHTSNASGNRSRNVCGARQVWAALYHADHGSDGTRQRIRGIWRAHQSRTARRKFAEGRALVARGKVVPGHQTGRRRRGARAAAPSAPLLDGTGREASRTRVEVDRDGIGGRTLVTRKRPIDLYWWSPSRSPRSALWEVRRNRVAWSSMLAYGGRPLQNFGDELSRRVVSEVTGRRVRWAPPEAADATAIGSVLEHIAAVDGPGMIWGTGLRRPEFPPSDWARQRPSRFLAVRGKLTVMRSRCLPTFPSVIPG